MSLLGIYSAGEGAHYDGKFEVSDLHLNVWILPKKIIGALVGYWVGNSYNCYIDVGVRFQVLSDKVSFVDLCLPHLIDKDAASFHDLSREVLDEKISDLIFGTKVTSSNHEISFGTGESKVNDKVIAIDNLKKIGSDRDQRYRITFRSAAAHTSGNNSFYFRFRYKCNPKDPPILKKAWGFLKTGYIVDVRVNDVRSTVNLSEEDMSPEMADINAFYGFIICPGNLIPSPFSPPFHYSRLLEPNAWGDYLQSCESFSTKHKLTIHQWRKSKISFQAPFRAFSHIHSEYGIVLFGVYMLGLISPYIIQALAKVLGWFLTYLGL